MSNGPALPIPARPPSQGGSWEPSAFYLRADENLKVTSYNALASVSLSVRARIYTADGHVEDSLDTQTPTTNRTATSTIIRTNEGWLLGGQVVVTGAAPLVGQTFVVVELVRGDSTAANAMQLLAAGYVTAKQPLVFPQAQPQSSLDGAGALRSISGTTPAAGAEISETVPTGARWQLLALAVTFIASATVATRTTTVIVDDGTNNLNQTVGINQATANQTAINYFGNRGVQIALLNGQNVTAPIGVEYFLGAGYRIRTSTGSIQIGDQYASPKYLVREWIEGA
ncbi:MAG: hypothetical protein AUI15_33835 [Actinobacteria bacterium 13_2_20CM_2_66_6]|nr:MAG: hypothetical protein AUI15_33835 [Actinobacteria bacterium 13_2_20CM_2_66_6]